MPQTESGAPTFRYKGRFATEDSSPSADHTALDNTATDTTALGELRRAVRRAKVVFIDDPLSYPWSLVDTTALVIVDASGCSPGDMTALRPVLSGLTAADTVLAPTGDAPVQVEPAGTAGATCPTSDQWDELHTKKQLHLAEREVRSRIKREVGEDAIIHRVTPAQLAAVAGGMVTYLADVTEESHGRLVGVWGVRSTPGAALDHGLVVFAPEQVMA